MGVDIDRLGSDGPRAARLKFVVGGKDLYYIRARRDFQITSHGCWMWLGWLIAFFVPENVKHDISYLVFYIART